MTSSARLALTTLALVALRSAPGPAAAQAAGAVPAPLAADVRAAVAERWAVDSARVQLAWGSLPSAAALRPGTAFELLGKGADGWFVTLFEPVSGSPVAVRVHAGTLDSVTVTARALAVNTTLAAEDLRVAEQVRWGAPARDEVVPGAGWTTRRALAAGDRLTPASAAPPQVVRAGDPVRLEWRRGGVIVALDGVALGSGALGQVVRVRMAERGGQRSGRVVGPNAVRLDS